MVPVYVLNLAADEPRWHAIQASAAGHCFLDVIRVLAVDGTALPDAACFPLTRNSWSINYKGTLACFLGHVRAWEMIAISEHPFSLFIEDDVRLHNLEMLSCLALPDGVDLAFCNDRTCYKPANGAPTFLPLLPVMHYVAQHLQGIGGDGYLLTPAGARKLLDFIAADGFFSHVDLRLFAYGVARDAAAEIEPADFRIAQDARAVREAYDAAHHIAAYVLSPFITQHPGGQDSRRAAADVVVMRG